MGVQAPEVTLAPSLGFLTFDLLAVGIFARVSLTHYIRLGFSLIPVAGGSRFECKKGTEVRFVGTTNEGILLLDLNPLQALSVKSSDPLDLHRALGHPSFPYLKKAFPDLTIKELDCDVCDQAKMHKQPFSGTFPTFSQPLDCIHMDLCGPITPASRGGNRYFLKIIDGFTKYRFIYPMRCKSDTFRNFQIFLAQAKTHTNLRLKMVVSDNGGEFCNKQFAQFYQEKGIQHLTSAPYTPQQNPMAERGNRTTVEKTRALLMTSGLPLEWWGEAVQLSVFLENRSPDSSIGFLSPFEKWHGHKPDLSLLVPFGCRAILFEERKWRDSKFSPSGIEAIFINYNGHHHSYKLWIPSSNKLVISHHVKFFPQTFPRFDLSKSIDSVTKFFDYGEDADFPLPDPSGGTPSEDVINIQDSSCPTPSPIISPLPDSPLPVDSPILEDQIPSTSLEVPSAPKGYDYVPYFDKAPKDVSSVIDQSNVISGSRRHRALVLVGEPSSLKDPKHYGEILGRVDENEWLMAVEVELGNMHRHEVWVVSPKTPGARELDTVWIFKRKFDADGALLKFKAHLCVRGFRQIEGLDFNATFALTGRLTTLRVMFGVAAVEDWDIQQMDVKCAFLNGVPEEDIFIKVPEGVGIELPPGHGLKLQCSLYGLKQSPRCWYASLKSFFTSVNFIPSVVDPCLFYHQDPSQPCFVFVHVDDLIIMGPDVSFLKTKINERFDMEDLGDCKYVLGMQITRDRVKGTITLSQDRYTKEILEEFGMENCGPASTPLPSNALTCPVPDEPVSPEFNYLSQFLNRPQKTHQQQYLQVLRYLQRTMNYGLTLGRVGNNIHQLVAYADSSYASGLEASSFLGSAVLHNGMVGWRCQKFDNDAPSLSTTEAEYRSCSETGQDVRWAQQLLDNIYPFLNLISSPITLYCDNQGALALLKDAVYQHRTRHINVRHHWLRFHIEKDKNFKVQYVQTNDNIADFLTKPLSPKKTRLAIGMVNLGDIVTIEHNGA
ncbi:hypothetical protein MJO29_002264 [Puccinia striiformis f. sp. tritici]|nr:hypothetical protein MJO29_002264 [Puccinia striiformis f. sp. tritici]